MDVMYFGDEEDSLEVEETFIKKIKGRFGDGILRDAYDSFKGHRQEVYLPDETQDNYFSWIIAKGYYNLSWVLKLLQMDKSQQGEFKRLVVLSQKQYPENFEK